jgi:GNAT superfamily N-acetyltransferase
MPAQLRLWRAALEDLDALVPLFDAYRQFYGLASDVALCRTFLAERIGRAESVVFLAAVSGGTAVGFTQMYPSFGSLSAAPLWILYDLFVAPQARKMGVARQLMKRARQHAEGTGAKTIVLSTARMNEAAQRLYESLGYSLDTEFLTYELSLPRRAPSGD